MVLAFLLIDGLIPWIFERVITRRRQGLHNFNVVVHIKTPPSHVILDPASTWILFVLAVGHRLDGILVNLRRLVLRIVPRYVPMSVVGVDDFRVE